MSQATNDPHISSDRHFGYAVNIAVEGLKALLFLNGGAATALIALTGNAERGPDYRPAVICFGFGAVFATVAIMVGYFSQLSYANHRLKSEQGIDGPELLKHARAQWISIGIVALSLAASGIGMWKAYSATAIQSALGTPTATSAQAPAAPDSSPHPVGRPLRGLIWWPFAAGRQSVILPCMAWDRIGRRDRLRCACIIVGLVLGSPASAREALSIVTPTRKPEAVFTGDRSALPGQIADQCVKRGWKASSITSTQVVCEYPPTSAASWGIVTGARSTGRIEFAIIDTGASSRIIATDATVLSRPIGEIGTAAGENASEAQDLLLDIDGAIPNGSQVSGVDLGFSAMFYTGGAYVQAVDPAGPAAQAGLQAGDRIGRINGKRIRDQQQFRKEAAEGETVLLSVR